MLIDNFGRPINYLRLSVTDRCNLRCLYCMPEEGINYLPREELLSYEELERIVDLLITEGITKIRITGGEPFVRRDLIGFLERLSRKKALQTIALTTNGVLTGDYLQQLIDLNITEVNLSLDSLDPDRFYQISRRNVYQTVMDTMHRMLSLGFNLKINSVVMSDKNTEDIIPLVELSRNHPVSVRFIEEMPFNGSGKNSSVNLHWNYPRILSEIKNHFPGLEKLPDPPNSTSYYYQVPGFTGKVGIIAAYSRTFCGTCNRIRITAQGHLKTCLYGQNALDIKHLIRQGLPDSALKKRLVSAVSQRHRDGFEAEKHRLADLESMSEIGG